MAKFTPEQYERRHRRLLEHAYRYKVLLPLVVRIRYGEGSPLAHPLKELAKHGFLTGFLRALQGGFSYYILGPKGAERLGVSREKAAPLSGSALSVAIATVFFCIVGRSRRYLLAWNEATQLFKTSVPGNVAFVMSDELAGEAKVFRVVHAASSDAADTVRHLRTLIDQASRHPVISDWLAAQQYGFAVLGTTKLEVAALEKVIERSGLRSHAPIICDLGPDAENYAAAAKEWEGNA